MKKIAILILLSLSMCIPNMSIAADNNFDQHFSLSVLFGAIGETVVHNQEKYSVSSKLLAGWVIGTVPGLIKEIGDSTASDNHFSEDQLLYDAMGSALGSFIAYKYNSRTKVSVSEKEGGAFISLLYSY